MGASNYVTLKVAKILGETTKAFLMRLPDKSEHWIPKSQIADPDDYEVDDRDLEISVTEWIANEKELPHED